ASSDNLSASYDHYYQNAYDIYVNETVYTGYGLTPFDYTYDIIGAVIDNPAGTYENYTNLSISDLVSASSAYSINWTRNSSALPSHRDSFAQKFVNISKITGTVSIDAITWHWTDAELTGYDESAFELWKYNASGWTMLNDTPDTGADRFILSGMDPASDYGILQYNLSNCPILDEAGTYVQTFDYIGAPNLANPVSGYACVKIASSDVVFDCNGFDITHNSSRTDTYGVLLNGTLSNVTVKNCALISGYHFGIYGWNSNDSVFMNNSFYNNSEGIYLYQSNTSLLESNTAYNNINRGYYLYRSHFNNMSANIAHHQNTGSQIEASINNTIRDSIEYNNSYAFYAVTASNNTYINNTAFNQTSGYSFLSSSSHFNAYINNTSHDNNYHGFYAASSNNNTYVNNTAYNNKNHGFYLATVTNVTLLDNTAFNNSGQGINLAGSNNTLLSNNISRNWNSGVIVGSGSNFIRIINNTIHNNSIYGIQHNGGNNNTIANNTVSFSSQYGMYLGNVFNSSITNNMLFNNSYYGIQLASSDFNNVSGNTVWNATSGPCIYLVSFSDNNSLVNNTAYRCSYGIELENARENLAEDNVVFSNTNDGFYLTSSAVNNNLVNNTASNNSRHGFYIYTGSTATNLSFNKAFNNSNTGFYIYSSAYTQLISNLAYNNSQVGFNMYASGFANITNSSAMFNRNDGFYNYAANNNTFSDCVSYNNSGDGFMLENSLRVSFVNCTAYDNAQIGFYLYETLNENTTITDGSAHNNSIGLAVRNSNNTIVVGTHFYNNRYDVNVTTTSSTPRVLQLNNVVIDNPAGNRQNFTNLSLGDYFSSTSGTRTYAIKWTSNSSVPPANYFSFAQKFVNISNFSGVFSSPIDNVTFHWLESELVVPYEEDKFELWKYNATGWTLLNDTPDLTANALAIFNFNPNSDYGILQNNVTSCPVITENGTYTQEFDFYGAPNPATPLSGYACVVIAASNVTYDCAGFNITYDGSQGSSDTYGILLNGSIDNVTVKNCNLINNYTMAGLMIYRSNSSSILNNTLSNNSFGLSINGSNSTIISGIRAINNSLYGLYVVDSDGLNMTDSNLTHNLVGGARFDADTDNANLTSNYICFNPFDIANFGTGSTGKLDRCDSWALWSENGHYGCEYSCSSLWHRFFGDTNGSLVLGNDTDYIYQWNVSSAYNIYFADYDSVVSWYGLQAIGRDTSNNPASNDFLELDVAFESAQYSDNITATYSTDGSSPKDTRNYEVYGQLINNIPVWNSTTYNTTFKTGILWDTSDGGTEYNNALNQTTVWMAQINESSADAYATYDYLLQIPYTLSTREAGNDLIAMYLEIR
ncbi:MAG: right-handed parallel beta-helix repeat-containing protein, partial [Candidatus Micrarchaeota archaeon]